MDTGSTDGSRALLVDALPDDSVVLDAPGASFGGAITQALDHLPSIDPGDQSAQWLWLLHDDSAPAAGALEALLDAVEKAPSVTMAGGKLMDAAHPDRLQDVGLSMTRAGRRFNRVSPDEVDQGQYDGASDVLAVNSAGMLVRRDIFEKLGGFDPALPGIGDDVDLGRREWLAGHRVIMVPDAHVLHHGDEVESVSGPRAERRAAAYTRLKYAPAALVPFLAVWMLLAGLGKAIGRLVAKDPSGAVIDLGAGATGLLRPRQLAAGRRSVAKNRRVPSGVVKALLVSPSAVRERRRSLREQRMLPQDTAAPALNAEASGGDDGFEALEPGRRPPGSASGGLIAVLLTAALSLLGLHRFLGAAAAQGGSLIPQGTSVGMLWDRAISGWQPLGTGAAAAPDPFDFLLWFSGVISFGHPQQAGVALYVLAMPLAALTGWCALGALTRSAGFRFFGALAWGLSPTLQIALAQGRPGAAVVHVILPLFVLAAMRAVGAARGDSADPRPGTGKLPSWSAAAAASLLAAVLICAEPVLALPLLVFGIVGTVLSRRSRALWWVPLPGLLLALPLLVRAVSDPRVLLVQPGVARATEAAPLWQQLLGWPVAVETNGALPGFELLGSGPWPVILMLVVAVPLGLLALLSLVRTGPGTTSSRVLVAVGLVAVTGGTALAHLDATVVGTQVVSPYSGSFVSVFGLSILLAAAAQREALAGTSLVRAPAAARATAGVLSTLVAISLVALATLWVAPRVVPGQSGQDSLATAQLVNPAQVSPLPATAADRGLGQFAERTLMISVSRDGQLEASLASGDGVRLEDLSSQLAAQRLSGQPWDPASTGRSEASTADQAIRHAVASLASGEQIDARKELSSLAVSYVVLRSGNTGADVLARELDAVPGLSPVGRASGDDAWIWRVNAQEGTASEVTTTGSSTARVRVESADGVLQRLIPSREGQVKRASVPSGAEGRLLVLAESANAGWHASLNGQELTSASKEWAQAFELPAGGGEVRVWYSQWWSAPWLILTALALAIALLSIIPVPRAWRADALTQRVYRPSVAQRKPSAARAAQEEA
ncbi:glycosyltransferase family 2 protein [Galactobacter caseinivorans]|uniref:Glycosyltransferase family 2 protein n=1 Tax=Galactobacter caseinivorans TaxID=2676123 RepID=A0A496PJH8_9MICC|nr:glycosyltransferase family 2 protein [Galactobacter caseinivorans]